MGWGCGWLPRLIRIFRRAAAPLALPVFDYHLCRQPASFTYPSKTLLGQGAQWNSLG